MTGYISVENSKLFYEIAGSGNPITLIHDGLVDCRVWDEQFSVFSEQYQVIRYDRRGYGRSERPWVNYSNVQDLHTLLNYLDVERTVLMGVSAGGMIAIDFTLAYPDMIAALILVGTNVNGFEDSEHSRQRIQAVIKPLVEKDNVEETIENWVNDPYFVSPKNIAARLRFREYLTSNPHNLYDPHWHTFEEPGQPAIDRLSELHVPTLLIVGETDIADNHAVSGALQVGIKGSKRVVLSNAGHLANLERPQIFNQLVAEFLESVLSGGVNLKT